MMKMNKHDYDYDFKTYLNKEGIHGPDRLSSHQYEKTIQDLMEKKDILETKLKASNQSKFHIVTSHKQIDDENSRLQFEMDQQTKENSRLASLSKCNQSQIKELQDEIESLKDKYRTKFEIIYRELMQKESEVSKLIMDIKEKDDKLSYMQVNNSMSLQYSENYKEEYERQKAINKAQLTKINEQEKLINELYMNKKSEGNLLLENEHLRNDNIRMLQMLKTTNEFKDFAFLNQTTPGGIRYVHDDHIIMTGHHNCQIAKSEENFQHFCDSWIPSEAFDLLLNYNKKYNMDLSEKVINDLLASLNTIWRQKEHKVIVRLKAKYQKEIIDSKRQCGIRIEPEPQPINVLIKSKPHSSKLKKVNSKGKEVVLNAMKMAESFNNTKIALEKEINTLKVKLSEREEKLKSKEDRDPRESLRIINKTLSEMDKMIIDFNDLLRQYTERVKDTKLPANSLEGANHNIRLIHNTVQWLFNSLKESIDNIYLVLSQWKKQISHQYV